MHPGPMNRGVEILVDPAELPGAVITQQVANGVAVRMAVLFELLGVRPRRRRGARHDVLIRGGRVVDQRGSGAADVLVDGGRVAAVGDDLDGDADDVLDAAGCVVAPGFVDLHAHLREPGREEAETIETGSRAAALGGYTAVVAMPNTDPPQDARGVVEFVRRPGRARPGCARCCRRAASRSAGPARRWRRTPSSSTPACGSSPTTATACRTRC